MNCSGFFLCPSLHFKTSYPYRPRNLWRVRYWSHCLPLRICGLVVMETSYFSKNCSYWSVARRKWPSECEEERGLGSPVKWPGLAGRKAAHSKHLGEKKEAVSFWFGISLCTLGCYLLLGQTERNSLVACHVRSWVPDPDTAVSFPALCSSGTHNKEVVAWIIYYSPCG